MTMEEFEEQFKEVAEKHHLDLTVGSDGLYANLKTHLFWVGYVKCGRENNLINP